MPLDERLRKRPIRPYQGAWNTGGMVYDRDAETPRAVWEWPPRGETACPLDSARPPDEQLWRWNPCSDGAVDGPSRLLKKYPVSL